MKSVLHCQRALETKGGEKLDKAASGQSKTVGGEPNKIPCGRWRAEMIAAATDLVRREPALTGEKVGKGDKHQISKSRKDNSKAFGRMV
jgi:hypothetical protein